MKSSLTKLTLFIILKLFIYSLSAQSIIWKDFRPNTITLNDGSIYNKWYLTIASRPASPLSADKAKSYFGHAFIIIGKEDHENKMSIQHGIGLYSKSDENSNNKENKYALKSGNASSQFNTILVDDIKTHAHIYKNNQVTLRISKTQYDKVIKYVQKYNGEYVLTRNDCISFVIGVAEELGIDMPDRELTDFPSGYLEKLINKFTREFQENENGYNFKLKDGNYVKRYVRNKEKFYPKYTYIGALTGTGLKTGEAIVHWEHQSTFKLPFKDNVQKGYGAKIMSDYQVKFHTECEELENKLNSYKAPYYILKGDFENMRPYGWCKFYLYGSGFDKTNEQLYFEGMIGNLGWVSDITFHNKIDSETNTYISDVQKEMIDNGATYYPGWMREVRKGRKGYINEKEYIIGEFDRDLTGKGKLVGKDFIYEGKFKDGDITEGTLKYNDGTTRVSKFQENKVLVITQKQPNNCQFVFKDFSYIGVDKIYGEFTYSDGKTYKGYTNFDGAFIDGQFTLPNGDFCKVVDGDIVPGSRYSSACGCYVKNTSTNKASKDDNGEFGVANFEPDQKGSLFGNREVFDLDLPGVGSAEPIIR